jgi:basic amino acid/polyamine antiporter, APA family
MTLVISAGVYGMVAATGVSAAGAEGLSAATAGDAAPLAVVARGFDWPIIAPLVAVGAMVAMLGVILNLLLGLSRVVLAMGRRGDLPGVTARLNRAGTTPPVAVVLVGVAIGTLTALGSVQATWSFSAFTVLIYYGITNVAALRLPSEGRIFSRGFAWIGLASCLLLAFCVDQPIWIAGLGLIAGGLVWHAAARRFSRQTEGARPV